MKSTSFGVLVFNQRNELLLGHATGASHWDIPKGGADPGEAPREAALRELREETRLVLEPASLTEIGLLPYTPRKELHLFHASVHTDSCDITACTCSSFFPHHRTGKMTPEVDRYMWVSEARLHEYATRSFTTLFRKLPPSARKSAPTA
ncbi:MAG: NUDIX hydrolase [Burkholderiales bacterium]|nr:MAG: NUDIX hydrolase [Burkholderiales bacterium]